MKREEGICAIEEGLYSKRDIAEQIIAYLKGIKPQHYYNFDMGGVIIDKANQLADSIATNFDNDDNVSIESIQRIITDAIDGYLNREDDLTDNVENLTFEDYLDGYFDATYYLEESLSNDEEITLTQKQIDKIKSAMGEESVPEIVAAYQELLKELELNGLDYITIDEYLDELAVI